LVVEGGFGVTRKEKERMKQRRDMKYRRRKNMI